MRRTQFAGAGVTLLLCIMTALAWLALHQRQIAVRNEQLAQDRLRQLKETAPTFYDRARALLEQKDLEASLKNASYTVVLSPEVPEYQTLRANLLQTLHRFDDARQAYRRVLELAPGDAGAAENLQLCDRFIRETRERNGLTTQSLAQWQASVQRQGRFVEALVLLGQLDANEAVRQQRLDQCSQALQRAGIAAQAKFVDGLLQLSAKDDPRTDWTGVRGLPFEWVYLPGCHISDLSPLAGMPLHWLTINNTMVTSLAPLHGLHLEMLDCSHTRINDISALHGMPLTALNFEDTLISDLRPLAGAPLTVLRAGGRIRDIRPLRGMPLRWLRLYGTSVASIDAVQGMPFTKLELGGTQVRDLKALRGMKLEILEMARCHVSDLRPLAGLPLKELSAPFTDIADLAPLAGMPLTSLALSGCDKLTDLRPLAECRGLEHLCIPKQCRDIAFLRSLPALKTLSYDYDYRLPGPSRAQSAAEFWQKFDSTEATSRPAALEGKAEGGGCAFQSRHGEP